MAKSEFRFFSILYQLLSPVSLIFSYLYRITGYAPEIPLFSAPCAEFYSPYKQHVPHYF